MLKASKVFDAIRTHLRAHEGHLECFGRYQFQAEGWLKAELVMLLDIMKTRGEIVDFDREIKAPLGGRIDLAFDLPGERHWVELKHYLIGKQKGQTWGLQAYMPYLTDELEKLNAVRAGERGWIVMLCTQNPCIESWDKNIHQFNHANAPWALVSQDVPSNYPASYFLGLLHIEGLAALPGTDSTLGSDGVGKR